MPRLTLAFALLALSACADPPDVYEVTVKLRSNTCGAQGLPLRDGTKYRAQVKLDGKEITWKVVPNGRPTPGTYNPDDGSFVITTNETLQAGNIDAGITDCTLIRQETLDAVLRRDLPDAGSLADATMTARDERRDDDDDDDDAPLLGEHRISFSADANGSCRSVTVLPPFERLPCEARYTVRGEHAD